MKPSDRLPAPLHRTLLILGLVLALWTLAASVFTVDVSEHGVVTRFGNVIRVVEEPGLNVKAPFDQVVRLDRRLLSSRPAQAEYLTEDKKNVVVRSLAVWRIAEPERFVAALGTRPDAEVRLADVMLAEIGAVLGTYSFPSLVSADERERRFRSMVEEVRERVETFVRPAYGIEIIAVDVRQLSLPEVNKRSVFERMKAERGRMAKQFRSEGERDATRMIAVAEREKTRILAAAHEQAARTRAEGEAEAMRVYARAFGRDEAFYKFLRTLQTYEKILGGSTTLFVPADAEVLRLLQDGTALDGSGPRPEAPADATDDLAAGEHDPHPVAATLEAGAQEEGAAPEAHPAARRGAGTASWR